MQWIYLTIAVIFEVTVGIAAGKAQGFRNIPWTIATLISGAIGYALWTSLAGVGIVIVGAIFLKQKLTWRKLLGIAIVIIGVVGLNLAGTV